MSCNIQDSPDAKKPCKGILKTSSSFDKQTVTGQDYLSNHRKSAKFDELNVLQTYHPPDKDYGHMKIEEPKTPYNYSKLNDSSTNTNYQLDAELLAGKLKIAAKASRRASTSSEGSSNEEPLEETDDQKVKRVEFEKRRKAHYNEFEAVKLARKLIEEEEDNDDTTTEHNKDNKIVDDDNDDEDEDDDSDKKENLIKKPKEDIDNKVYDEEMLELPDTNALSTKTINSADV